MAMEHNLLREKLSILSASVKKSKIKSIFSLFDRARRHFENRIAGYAVLQLML